jgi:hypothetical protein
MALKRYVGPDSEVSVVVAGREMGIVKNGEAIVVPDELAELVVWQDQLWEDGAPVKKLAPVKDDK